MDSRLLEVILDDIKELKTDMKTLLAFKWQIIGGSVIISAVISLVASIAIAWISK